MPDINGIPYVESSDLVSAYPAASQALAQEVSDQLASKLPYSYGTATPSTTDSGFLWYDSNSTPAAPKFWDGAAFQALSGGGKILQIVRATDGTQRSTSSTSYVDANIEVTITPTDATSALIILWSVFVIPANNNFVRLQITDTSNNPVSGAEDQGHGSSSGSAINIGAVEVAYATPATTSPVTYKGRFRIGSISPGNLRNDLKTGQMFAIEVAA